MLLHAIYRLPKICFLCYNQKYTEREGILANHVIIIDRKKYAAGLFWQPVAVGFVPRNYARSLARGVDKKLNLYTEYRAMVGVGSKRNGLRMGMPAAAAEVMESFAEYSSFLAIFPVGQLFWMVAVRNGIIIVDKIFENEDVAREEYLEISSMPDWGSLFAPSAWGIPRAVDRILDDVVSGTVRATLKPISRVKSDLIAIILLVVFVFGIGYFFREPIAEMLTPKTQIAQIDPLLAEEYKKRIEEKNRELDEQFNIQRQAEQQAVHNQIMMPYDYLPDPIDRAQTCYQAIAFLMQPISGWVQTDAECTETHANVTLRRTHGTLIDFYEQAGNLMPGAFVQERTDSEIFVRAKLPELETFSSMEEKDAATIVREVNTMFQLIDSSVDTSITIDVIGEGVDAINLDVVEVAATSKLIPTQFMQIFNDLRGVYLSRVVWDARSKNWNYEVIIYAK